ncbi:hypothetical protein VTH06DRAFT_371 [Thermothelomyces fergusii]
MAHRFLAALAIAHSATAALDRFVDVLVQVDEFRLHTENLAADDEGFEACKTADAVIGACYYAGYLDPSTPDGYLCECCYGTTPMAGVYSTCGSWALDQSATRIYRVVSQVSSACADVTACGDSDSLPTGTSAQLPPSISLPPACVSMRDIYSSCAAIPSVYTGAPRDVAACFCPEEDGKINKSFQSYASSCAPFARSAFPDDYSIITQLQTYCDANMASTSLKSLVFTTIGTRTGLEFGPPSITSSATSPTSDAGTVSESANPDSESAVTTASSTGLAPQGLTTPGIAAWLVELAALVLSYFVMV